MGPGCAGSWVEVLGGGLRVAVLVLTVVVAAAAVTYVAAALPRGGGYVRVVPKGLEFTPYTTYVAELYVGDRVVRSLYVRVVDLGTYSELLVSLGWREDSEVRSLEVEVSPPPGRVVPDTAWVANLGDPVPVEFYRRGPAVVWRCRDLGAWGQGTVTLEFILKDQILGEYSIRVRGVLRYGGADYLLDHTFAIPRPAA
jgi:hypothetical protein